MYVTTEDSLPRIKVQVFLVLDSNQDICCNVTSFCEHIITTSPIVKMILVWILTVSVTLLKTLITCINFIGEIYRLTILTWRLPATAPLPRRASFFFLRRSFSFSLGETSEGEWLQPSEQEW